MGKKPEGPIEFTQNPAPGSDESVDNSKGEVG